MVYLGLFSFAVLVAILFVVFTSKKIERASKAVLILYLLSVGLWIAGLVYSRIFYPTEILIEPDSLLFYGGLITFIAAVSAFFFQYFFALTYGQKYIKLSWIAKINIGIFLVFLVLTSIPGLVLESFILPESRDYLETHKGPLILGYVAYILYFYISTVVVLIKRIKKTENLVLKAQLKCLLFGAGVFLGLAIFTNLILSSIFNNPQLNSLGPAFYMIEAAVYVYAVSRYRFLNLEHLWPLSHSTVFQIKQLQVHFLESLKKGTLRLKQILQLNQVELVLAGDNRLKDLAGLYQYAQVHDEEIVRSELEYQILKSDLVDKNLMDLKTEMERYKIVAMIPIKKDQELLGLLLLENETDRLFSVQEMTSLKRVMDEATYLIVREQHYEETLAELSSGNQAVQKELFKDLMHEVRTPLMLARNIPDLIDWARLKPEDQAYLKQSQDSLQGLSVKLEHISEAFQWSQGTIPLQKTRATLGELVEFVQTDLAKVDPDYQSIIKYSWKPKKLKDELLFFDMARLQRLITELFKNSVFFQRENQSLKVHIAFSEADEQLQLTYSDNAQGIPEDCWMKVFDLMFVVAESRNPTESGTGVGLTIVKGIAEAHGGSVKIKKSSSQEGTTFVIEWPLEKAT